MHTETVCEGTPIRLGLPVFVPLQNGTMSELAQWRSHADDPKTPIGWLVGVDRWHGVPVYAVVASQIGMALVVADLLEGLLPAFGAFVRAGVFGIVGVRLFSSMSPKWLTQPSTTGPSRLPPTNIQPKQRLRSAGFFQVIPAGLAGGVVSIAVTTLPRLAYPLHILSVVGVGALVAVLLYGIALREVRRGS